MWMIFWDERIQQRKPTLRKWNSNSEEVINSSEKSRKTFTSKSADLIQDDESYTKSMVGPADNQDGKCVKVLGVNWNTKADEFLFNFTELVKFANTFPIAKRSLLEISAKVFDPLGFVTLTQYN